MIAPHRSSAFLETGSSTPINRRLVRRARFPPPVQPEPLVRIAPDVIFNHAGKSLRIFADVRCVVSGANQFDRRFKAEPVFPQRSVPVKKSRHHGRIGMEREPGKPAVVQAGMPKKSTKTPSVSNVL